MAKKKSESTQDVATVTFGKVNVKPENIRNIQGPDFRSIYSNNVAFAMSIFDISFIFGEISGSEGETITVDQKVKITMSPQHAKVLAMVLIQNLKNYEETIVPIPLPPGISAAPTPPPQKNGKSHESNS
jgi:hypothetical protein